MIFNFCYGFLSPIHEYRWGSGTKDVENKSRFKDFNLTKQFCPVTDR